jgi:hypothetical protein
MRPRVAFRASHRWIKPLAACAALMILATACGGGGGGGGGGGDSAYTFRVLLENQDPSADHVLSYSGGAPLANSPDDETVESCTAAIVYYEVVVPFELLVDDVPVIISDELEFGVPADGETNLIATMQVQPDGTAVPVIGDSSGGRPVAEGTGLSKPAALGICN